MTVSHDVLVITQYNEANKNIIQSDNMLKHEVMTFMRYLCSTVLAVNTAHSNFKVCYRKISAIKLLTERRPVPPTLSVII
jgi:hypothetical protein